MRRRARAWAVIAGAMALSVGVAGVPAIAATNTKPVTVSVYVIGSRAGGIIPFLNDMENGANAAKKVIEKAGDLKFDITACDGKGDQNQLRKCGEDAIAANADVAIVGDASQAGAGLVSKFETANIPVFYVVTTNGSEDKAGNAMLPVSPSISISGGTGVAAARLGFKKDAVLVRPKIAEPLARYTVLGYEGAGGEPFKATIDSPLSLPGTANPPDLAPTAQKIVDENPKVVVLSFATILQELRVAGFDGPIVGAGATSELLKSLDSETTNNLYAVGQSPPVNLKKPLPIVKRFTKEMKAIGASGDDTDLTPYAYNSWQDTYAIATQAALMKGDFNNKEFLNALNASKGIELVDGRVWVPSGPGPTGYPRDSAIVYWITKYVGDGKWKLVKTPPEGNVAPAEYFNE
jgi:Periplasmic binding protein